LIHALIDGKKVVVSEDVIKRDLHLDDADGFECLPNEEIFTKLARMGYEKPPPKLKFYNAFFSTQWKFLIHTLVQCLSAKRTACNEFICSVASAFICLATGRKLNFSRYIFDSMLQVDEEVEEVEIPITHASPSPTNALSPSSQDPTPIPHATPPTLPPQEQPTTTSESSMSLLTTLMETCSSLSQKVAELEQDKHTQALEIIKLKKRVKKLEKKKKKSKSTGFKRLRKVGTSQRVESFTDTVVGAQEDASKQREGKIKAINVDEDITLMNVEKDEEVVAMDAELQGRNNQEEVNVASKGVNAVEPTVFDDEEVIMTMAQTLIKMKAKKS
nr:synaptobrevin, longin-like domain protein [Tanacetum cinerariifolium]